MGTPSKRRRLSFPISAVKKRPKPYPRLRPPVCQMIQRITPMVGRADPGPHVGRVRFSAHRLHRIHSEACRVSEELLKLLGGLGATPQDIAARLSAEGIRAQRGSPSFQNPIVRYIYRHLNLGGLIYV